MKVKVQMLCDRKIKRARRKRFDSLYMYSKFKLIGMHVLTYLFNLIAISFNDVIYLGIWLYAVHSNAKTSKQNNKTKKY